MGRSGNVIVLLKLDTEAAEDTETRLAGLPVASPPDNSPQRHRGTEEDVQERLMWAVRATSSSFSCRAQRVAEDTETRPARGLNGWLAASFRFSPCLCASVVNLLSPRLQQNAERLPHSEEEGFQLHAAAEIVAGAQRGGELVGFAGG